MRSAAVRVSSARRSRFAPCAPHRARRTRASCALSRAPKPIGRARRAWQIAPQLFSCLSPWPLRRSGGSSPARLSPRLPCSSSRRRVHSSWLRPSRSSRVWRRAARRGIVVKGGTPLERLGAATVVVFDKTGTLTTGHPRVIEATRRPAGCQPRRPNSNRRIRWLRRFAPRRSCEDSALEPAAEFHEATAMAWRQSSAAGGRV